MDENLTPIKESKTKDIPSILKKKKNSLKKHADSPHRCPNIKPNYITIYSPDIRNIKRNSIFQSIPISQFKNIKNQNKKTGLFHISQKCFNKNYDENSSGCENQNRLDFSSSKITNIQDYTQNQIYDYKSKTVYNINKNNLAISVPNKHQLIKENNQNNENSIKMSDMSSLELSEDEDNNLSRSRFNLAKYEENEKQLIIHSKNNKNKIKTKGIKKNFLFIISYIYYSLYLLFLKTLLVTSTPEKPTVSVSLFIIFFNNLLLSMIFMKLDHIIITNNFNYKEIGDYILKIIINFLKILLTIKSLEHINLLSLVLIINLSPVVMSYINLRQKNAPNKFIDKVFYTITIIICVYELSYQNIISILCSICLMILFGFSSFIEQKTSNNFHPYIIIFGSSIIGIAISQLFICIKTENLYISLTQYVLFILICFSFFLNNYFECKYNKYFNWQQQQRFSIIELTILTIVYSKFILKEKNRYNTPISIVLSLLTNIYGKIRINSTGDE